MNWKPEMDELRRREEFAEALGGAERVKRQHDAGRLTIRERIGRLVDEERRRAAEGHDRIRDVVAPPVR